MECLPDMESNVWMTRLQDLGDLGLALFASLVAHEHCLLSTEPDGSRALLNELCATCEETFSLSPAVVMCSPKTTIDDFNDAILVNADATMKFRSQLRGATPSSARSNVNSISSQQIPARSEDAQGHFEQRTIADVVIAFDLDIAPTDVQVQALELIRSRRIFTRSSMQVAPKGLLFIAILSKPHARLMLHLQDMFAISHFHSVGDAPFNPQNEGRGPIIISRDDIDGLRKQVQCVSMSAEIAQYLHNIPIFLRNSRYVKGGVTATATRHLRKLSQTMAALHDLDFVSPSLVALCARKVYPHRLVLASAENEKTLLWGSQTLAVQELLNGLTPEDVVEEVLASIEAPL